MAISAAKNSKVNQEQLSKRWRPTKIKSYCAQHTTDSNSSTFGNSRQLIQRQCARCADAEDKLQTKLSLGAVNDPLERQADVAADQVVQGFASGNKGASVNLRQLQGKANIQRKKHSCEQPCDGQVTGRLRAKLSQSKGKGQSMATSVQAGINSAFGLDLSAVRIHTDSDSEHMNRQLNAKAFTYGKDIYFGSNQYRPDTRSGMHLLAHEMAHVIQQDGASGATIYRSPLAGRRARVAEDEPNLLDRAINAFKSFNKASIDLLLPVGTGIYFQADGNITWGIPAVGAKVTYYIRRVDQNHLSLTVYKQGRLFADVGVGGGFYIGAEKRSGKNKGHGAGGSYGADAQAGAKVIGIEEYRFELDKLIIFAAKGVYSGAGRDLLFAPLSALLHKEAAKYRIRSRLELNVFAQAAAEASIGVNRPGEISEGGTNKLENKKWTHSKGERAAPSDLPNEFKRDPMSIFNFLRASANILIRAGASVGIENEIKSDKEIFKLYMEGELSFLASLPIPGINQILAMIPGFGAGAEIRVERKAGKEPKIFLSVYIKGGEDQLYDGVAYQDTFVFDLTNFVSFDELINAFKSGKVPKNISLSGIKSAFTGVKMWKRISMFSPIGRNFNTFLRRQTGVRTLLGGTTKNRAEALGIVFTPYLTFSLDISGPDFLAIANLFHQTSQQAAGKTKAVNDLKSAWHAVRDFLVNFNRSKEYQQLIDKVLDATYVNSAEFLIQYGIGLALGAKLGASVKARGDISLGLGRFCSIDFLKELGKGGRITLRELLVAVPDLIDNPRKYMPNCSILDDLMDYSYAGGRGSGNQSSSSGNSVNGQQQARFGGLGGSVSGRQGQQDGEAKKKRKSQRHSGFRSTPSNNRYQGDRVFELGQEVIKIDDKRIKSWDDLIQLNLKLGQSHRIMLHVFSARDVTDGATFLFNQFFIWVPAKLIKSSNNEMVLEITRDWWVDVRKINYIPAMGTQRRITKGVGAKKGNTITLKAPR